MKLSHLFQSSGKPPWRVIFFGGDDFSLKVLEALFENSIVKSTSSNVIRKLAIVHPLTKKMSPVQKYAAVCGIEGFQWPLRQCLNKFDVGVVASFGHLLPEKVLNMFPYGVINVHPSLLPQWRGAAPIHHSILNGDLQTGVSIMALRPKHFDTGPLLLQKDLPMPQRPTMKSLRDFLATKGGEMIIDVLSHLPEYLENSTPQGTEVVSYAHKLTQKSSFIDWQNHTRDEIDRQYRTLNDSMELRSIWEGKTVRLLDMVDPKVLPSTSLEPNSQHGLPIFMKQDHAIWIKCKDGWVGFRSIVIKKKMSAQAFYNGYLSKSNANDVAFISTPNNLFNDTYNSWIQNPRTS